MANKTIEELIKANSISNSDMLLLSQGSVAKSITWGKIQETVEAKIAPTLDNKADVSELNTLKENLENVDSQLSESVNDISKASESVNVIKTNEPNVTVGFVSSRVTFPIYLKPNRTYNVRNTELAFNALVHITNPNVERDSDFLISIAEYSPITKIAGIEFTTLSTMSEGWYQLYIRATPKFEADSPIAHNWMCNYSELGLLPYSDYFETREIADNKVSNSAIKDGTITREKLAENVLADYVDTSTTYNLWDRTDLDVNNIINTSNGITVIPSAGSAYTKSFIPVNTLQFWANLQCIIYGYDENKNFLTARYIQQDYIYSTAFPNTLRYIRIATMENRHTKDFMLVEGTKPKLYTSHKVVEQEVMPITNTWFTGRKIATIGDSITAMGTWQPHVAEALNANIVNCGIGGTLVCGISDLAMWQDIRINGGSYSGYTPVGGGYDGTTVTGIPTDADVVLVMGGVNDWASGKTLGALTDTDTTKFYGAYKTMLDKIYAKVPNAKIFLMNTPHHTDEPNVNSANHTLEEFREAVRKIGKLYGYPVFEIVDCGINSNNASKYLQDTVHPNYAGGILVANKVVREMLRNEPIYR